MQALFAAKEAADACAADKADDCTEEKEEFCRQKKSKDKAWAAYVQNIGFKSPADRKRKGLATADGEDVWESVCESTST